MKVWCLFENKGRHVKPKLVAVASDKELLEPTNDQTVEEWEIGTDIWGAVRPEIYYPTYLLCLS